MRTRQAFRGFSLIELMIVLAIIAVLLSLALPAYQDYTIRSKVTEGLSLAAGVKVSVSESCQVDPSTPYFSILDLGYSSVVTSTYVEWLNASSILSMSGGPGAGTCSFPLIAFKSINTGAEEEPIIVLVALMNSGSMAWACYMAAGDPQHVPSSCRNNFPLPGLFAGPGPGGT